MISYKNKIYYLIKPFMPRRLQIFLRRKIVLRKQLEYKDIWPIDKKAGKKADGWLGWPNQKKFALILTHDVDTAKGQERCYDLMQIEKQEGFISSFNFV